MENILGIVTQILGAGAIFAILYLVIKMGPDIASLSQMCRNQEEMNKLIFARMNTIEADARFAKDSVHKLDTRVSVLEAVGNLGEDSSG